MTAGGTAAAYGLPNSWVDARRRLALIGECLDGISRRRFELLGELSGWRCLDVGAGGGSVASLLVELVGPRGMVVATDIDTRFLEERKAATLDVWQHDITADPLPEAAFDLIHTRSLLMHLPARRQVIEKLTTAVRPGGWLVLEESDCFPIDATAPEPYRGAWVAVNDALAATGMSAHWARHLPGLLGDLGLVDVAADAEVTIFPGASPMAELMRLSFQQVQAGVAPGARPTVDAAIAALDDPRRWFPGHAVIGVRARRHCPA